MLFPLKTGRYKSGGIKSRSEYGISVDTSRHTSISLLLNLNAFLAGTGISPTFKFKFRITERIIKIGIKSILHTLNSGLNVPYMNRHYIDVRTSLINRVFCQGHLFQGPGPGSCSVPGTVHRSDQGPVS